MINGYGKRLNTLRLAKGYSMQDVCSATGISASSLSAYEAEQRIPRDEIKVRLAKFYNTAISELF